MNKKIKTDRLLVVFTCSVLFILFCGSFIYSFKKNSKIISIDTKNQPTFGDPNADVHLVIFEDFLCVHCKKFSKDVLPRLKEEYIDTGKVKCSLISLAFMEGSHCLANAALTVYHHNPDNFFPYLQQINTCLPGKEAFLEKQALRCAFKIEGIDTVAIRESIQAKKYNSDLQRNIAEARRVMGSNMGTPAIYINGAYVSALSYEKIRKELNQVIKGK